MGNAIGGLFGGDERVGRVVGGGSVRLPPIKPEPKIRLDPDPPERVGTNKRTRKVTARGVQTRRRAQRRGRSQTILTKLDEEQEAPEKSRDRPGRKTKIGGV